jgi:crotonobetainyl-CoA:carnitine CoA-transferase CaiB-like acyl-CoA transferase
MGTNDHSQVETSKKDRTPRALEGIRVIEWATFFSGPTTASLLGDLGADVIKIEQPQRGDAIRGVDEVNRVSVRLPNGSNVMAEAANRNKRCITLDLSKEAGKKIAYRLIEKSDIFITNFLSATIAKCGMDYETIMRINPTIIYASMSGYGRKGPWADSPSFDLAAQAYSGMMMCMGEPDYGPTLLHVGPVDQMTSTLSALQIVTALLVRERQGIGQEVHTSLLGAAMWMMHLSMTSASLLGIDYPRHERKRAPNPLRNFYPCKDGTWIAVVHFQSTQHWSAFCKAVGINELEKDPRFLDASAREKNSQELISLLDARFATKPRGQWEEDLRKHGIICSPVHRMTDLLSDPQVLANDYLISLSHPDLGQVSYPNTPLSLSKTPAEISNLSPTLGQHTEEVLIQLLDYTWDEISKLRDEGIV